MNEAPTDPRILRLIRWDLDRGLSVGAIAQYYAVEKQYVEDLLAELERRQKPVKPSSTQTRLPLPPPGRDSPRWS